MVQYLDHYPFPGAMDLVLGLGYHTMAMKMVTVRPSIEVGPRLFISA